MTRFLASCGLAAMACGLLTGQAAAQVVASPADETVTNPEGGEGQTQVASGLDEIVVTASKRESALQDTPLAITAIGGAAMEERGIDDVNTLQSYVPNLRVGQEQDGVKVTLRGIGIQGTSSITDNGVAFYQDNFYLSRPAASSAIFFDVNRVEVLRGPQGTLYGRNATGGVINIIANEPEFGEFSGLIGASYGSRNAWEARGVINAPLGDIAALRVAAVYSQEDGYLENLGPGPDLYGSDGDITVRAQLLFGDPDSVELLLYGLYSELNGTGSAVQYITRNIGGPPPVQALLRTLPPLDPNPRVTNLDAETYLDVDTRLVFARLRKDFGGFEVFLQGGRMWQEAYNQQDFDGTPVNVGIFNKDQDNESTSVELRLASNGDGPFSWIVGGYYFDESTYIFRRVRLRGLTPGGQISLPDFLLDEYGNSTTLAGFASLTYAITDAFRLTGGIRYTQDDKDGRKITRGNFGQPFPPDLPNAQFPADVSFDKVTWKVGAEYDVEPNVLVYASMSNGYKAGGFNLSSDGRPYNPEEITAYELGLKSDLFGRTARINVDAFYYDYTDLQLTTLGVAADGVTPGQFTTNAAASTIWGIEIDTQWELTPGFVFSAGYAYTDATFDELFNRDPLAGPGPLVDLSGNRLPYVAEHTVTLGISYEIELGSGSLTFAANSSFHSDLYLREFNNYAVDRVPANSRTDLTVTWRLGEPNISVTAFATNLEDEVERNNIYLTPGFIGVSPGTAYTKPRTFGIRVDYAF